MFLKILLLYLLLNLVYYLYKIGFRYLNILEILKEVREKEVFKDATELKNEAEGVEKSIGELNYLVGERLANFVVCIISIFIIFNSILILNVRV